MRHSAKNVRHGAKNLPHGAKNVRHGAKNVRHGAVGVIKVTNTIWTYIRKYCELTLTELKKKEEEKKTLQESQKGAPENISSVDKVSSFFY